MDSKKADVLQGTLDLLILKTVAHGPIHGYAIAQKIFDGSESVLQVQQGSLYPALHRLENRGLIQAEWKESANGRMAKLYALTRTGRKQLDNEIAQWQRYARAIGLILQTQE